MAHRHRPPQNVVTYDVVVAASNPELLLEPGMTATMKIVVHRRDNVLRAPGRAVAIRLRDLAVPGGGGGPRSAAGWLAAGLDTCARGKTDKPVSVWLGLDDGAYTEVDQGWSAARRPTDRR